jgi:hypothetical protein
VTQPLKLFFDECCSKKLARKIVEIYDECYPGIQTKHLSDFFALGTLDPDWIPLLEKDKDWIVLTADRGRKGGKNQKLPLICGKFGVTHISMTPLLKAAGYKAHKQALLSVWPQIVKIPLLPKGTKVSLGYKMFDKGLSKIPWLTIEQQSFEIWCHEKGIKNPN